MNCLSHGSAFCAEDAAHLNGALPDTPVGAESYAVFPGIALIYNCFTDCDTGSLPGGGDGILVIDHCRGGRVEYAANGALCFLADGDLLISQPETAARAAGFPQRCYDGITIRIDVAAAPACLSCLLDDVEVSPAHLAEKFCGGGRTFVARSDASIEHIFSELYAVPPEIRKGYFKVKILELLLFLRALDVKKNETGTHILSPSQLALAREVCAYLTARMDERITLDMLAHAFHVSGTSIKNSFKAVYGASLYAFIRTQKMQAAAKRLAETDRSVLEIAGEFGYDNASKFAKAFRDALGMTPGEFRRRGGA
jgi:transcriptional regulator, araC family